MIILKQTCTACPEQYDAFIENKQVGYLRLRHGIFTVLCPDHHGIIVYEARPNGDGIFHYEERDYYLRFAVHFIENWLHTLHTHSTTSQIKPPAPNVKYTIE